MSKHHIWEVIGGGVIVITAPTRCQVSLENLAGVFLSRHKQEIAVDMITGNIKKIYLHYLFAGFGSAIITSIYSTVDVVVSGQYEGPVAPAALSVISPMWSLFISIGLLFGIGGAILATVLRGEGDEARSNEFFTVSLFSCIIISILITVFLFLFKEEFLRLCGADAEVLPYALSYVKWLVFAIPFFLVGTVLSAFIRNDGVPFLSMLSVVSGGVLNIFGDIFFVFTCDMGIEGAGLATMLGQSAAFVILCTHFFSKRCKLRIVKPKFIIHKLIQIVSMGFSPFIVDISFGFIIFCFNNQIMRYSNSTYLAVFGTITNITALIQSLFYGIGQAIQPIVSSNFGAKRNDRVRSVLRYSFITTLAMGITFFAILVCFSDIILQMYMHTTDEILTIGPGIVRTYSFAYLLMGMNIVASYYLQALKQSNNALLISLLRGFAISLALIFLLPATAGFNAIWLTMPLTELLTLFFALALLRFKKPFVDNR
jgi:putative MATE family efflux protein